MEFDFIFHATSQLYDTPHTHTYTDLNGRPRQLPIRHEHNLLLAVSVQALGSEAVGDVQRAVVAGLTHRAVLLNRQAVAAGETGPVVGAGPATGMLGPVDILIGCVSAVSGGVEGVAW